MIQSHIHRITIVGGGGGVENKKFWYLVYRIRSLNSPQSLCLCTTTINTIRARPKYTRNTSRGIIIILILNKNFY